MSLVGRHVARARGRALRAIGAPRLPNLPSGRALVQRELRRTVDVPRTVGSVGTGSSTGTTEPTGRRRHRTEDRTPGALPAAVAVVGVAVAVWLLVATGVPDARPTPPVTNCYDRVVYHAARLSDC